MPRAPVHACRPAGLLLLLREGASSYSPSVSPNRANLREFECAGVPSALTKMIRRTNHGADKGPAGGPLHHAALVRQAVRPPARRRLHPRRCVARARKGRGQNKKSGGPEWSRSRVGKDNVFILLALLPRLNPRLPPLIRDSFRGFIFYDLVRAALTGCTSRCHPGFCPPCPAMAPPRPCFCGRTTATLRCRDAAAASRSCGGPCGRPLLCGRHACTQPCHDGRAPLLPSLFLSDPIRLSPASFDSRTNAWAKGQERPSIC